MDLILNMGLMLLNISMILFGMAMGLGLILYNTKVRRWVEKEINKLKNKD